MRGIHLTDMVKQGTFGTTTIKVDAREFNVAMDKAEDDIAKAIWYGIGKALSYAKDQADRHIRSFQSYTPQAKRVADSLGYEREYPEKDGDGFTVEAIFGSRGPHPRGSLGGEGVMTEPDDNGGTYPIAAALEEGRPAHHFQFKGNKSPFARAEGAIVHGRQMGRYGSNTGWFGWGGTGYFSGYPAIGYLDKAEGAFSRRVYATVSNQMKRRLG